MANLSLADEYAEILSAEVTMDVGKLRDLARLHGIPPQFRGDVWRYLLGIVPSDLSHEVSSARARSQSYETMCASAMSSHIAPDTAKLVRGEFSRYLRRVPVFAQLTQEVGIDVVRGVFERIIITFLSNHSDLDYEPPWIHVLAPFVASIRDERDVYFCFEAFMLKLSGQQADLNLSQQMASVLSLLRTSLPELYNYLDEEEVDVRAWLPNWLQYAFASELPFDALLRLWDVYLAETKGFQLHPYVCLAVLHQLKEALEEMESSEVIAMLKRLPFRASDIDTLINVAKNLRLDAQQGEARDEEMYRMGTSSLAGSRSSSR
ncbi:rab-GTPase-TBC domain-containing protein [Catenaria anguillulae PL171]|uniref:Rab-GTPase-TBC domain-containing protein n=1 Tax=Catenaria anguillulae PL171 TaxID=765915 RepID=A0A1Y2HC17_9FUNG|nr:rab-GTPase-TBC domain-containing protein [Catenaria anguillulae PL171]